MEPGFFFAMLFWFIGAIVLIRSVTEVMKRRIAFKERKLELEHGVPLRPDGKSDANDMVRFEERLRVLERIATDPTRNLAAEIEDLRSKSIRETV